jgi:hypothetical protein
VCLYAQWHAIKLKNFQAKISATLVNLVGLQGSDNGKVIFQSAPKISSTSKEKLVALIYKNVFLQRSCN